jgi:hypothetical protein
VVEHSLSKRKVVGSNPAYGLFCFCGNFWIKTNGQNQPTGGVEPPTFRLQSECSATKLSRLVTKGLIEKPVWPSGKATAS